jgi:hypothetical protein
MPLLFFKSAQLFQFFFQSHHPIMLLLLLQLPSHLPLLILLLQLLQLLQLRLLLL